jgi:hypothetical protein
VHKSLDPRPYSHPTKRSFPVLVLHLQRTGASQSLFLLLTLLLLSFTRPIPRDLISFLNMLSKSFIAPIFLLALTSSVNAHAAVAPALGVEGTPTLNDVQKPSTDAPCGNINIADSLDTSTPVAVSSDGEFVVTITNFE